MQIGFWDESLRLEKLSKLGDSLERLNVVIDWEIFRPILNGAFKKETKGAGCCEFSKNPPYPLTVAIRCSF